MTARLRHQGNDFASIVHPSLTWYLNRLRAMSIAEIGHRVLEQGKRASWRSYEGGWARFDHGDGALPIVSALGKRLDDAAAADSGFLQRLAKEAEALLRGNLVLLGQAWPPGTLTDLQVRESRLFHRDPVSGRLWPKADRYCFDAPRSHTADLGDPKFLCELNRLQFLQVIAAHARLSGDRALSERVFDVILHWMDANPPYRGLNWNSGIELAMRIVSLVVVLSFLGEPANKAVRVRFRAFLSGHAFWLARYPSRYSSANNHLIAEATGRFLVGLLVPDLSGSPRDERDARTILEQETQRQILEDGVGAEQSPTYTAFSMEMIAFSALVAGIEGRPLSVTVEERLRAGAEHLAWLMNEAGAVPAIGDNDEGRVLVNRVDSEPRYVSSVVNCVAGGEAGGGAVGSADGSTYIREALFGVHRAVALPPKRGCRTFEEGGYSIVREDVHGRPLILVFDHGPLGYLSIAAHGHADALAIWLDVAGRPVLADAGTWLYHAGGAARDALRSTATHNTVMVEDASQSLPAGAFNWSHRARARLVGSSAGEPWWFAGEHDGYLDRFGVRHIRRVAKVGPGEILISDQLDGPGGHRRGSIRFLLAPDLSLAPLDHGFIARRDDGFSIILTGPPGMRPRAIAASAEGMEGWVCTRFGKKVPSTILTFDGHLGTEPVSTRLRLSFADGS